jgi:tetratricopeptide (TPR) repeat protein
MSEMPHTDPNPTPEFDAFCMSILRSWRAGEMPFNEAISAMTQKGQDALHEAHLANQARAEQLLGYLQHYRGNLNTSIRHYDRARELFQQAGNDRRLMIIDLGNGENYRLKGDFSKARRLYRSAYETARTLSELELQTMAVVNEGLVLLALNQYLPAARAFQEGLDLCAGWRERFDERPAVLCEVHHGLTTIYLEGGQLDLALTHAGEALAAAAQSGEPRQVGYAYRALGEVVTRFEPGAAPLTTINAPLANISDPDECFRAALQAFREVHMEAEIARTMFAQARSLAWRGRRTTAARKLQQVMIMFSELGMVDDAARAAEAQLAVI